MKYFFTNKVKIVLIVAVLLTAGLAIVGNLLGKTPADKAVQGILTPLRNGVNSLTHRPSGFITICSGMKRWRRRMPP